jgi:hypothetical protein
MIVSNQVATMLARGSGNIGDLLVATRAEQIAQLVGIAAAVLAILVVRGVDARQNREEVLGHVFE